MINLHSLNLDRTKANSRCKQFLEGMNSSIIILRYLKSCSYKDTGLEHLRPVRVPAAAEDEDSSSDSDGEPGPQAHVSILY